MHIHTGCNRFRLIIFQTKSYSRLIDNALFMTITNRKERQLIYLRLMRKIDYNVVLEIKIEDLKYGLHSFNNFSTLRSHAK